MNTKPRTRTTRLLCKYSASIGFMLLTTELVPNLHAQVWNELGDAGELLGTAQTPQGSGVLHQINGSINPNDLTDIDLYRFRIDSPTTFAVDMEGTPVIDNLQKDTQIFLFDHLGRYVDDNDDADGFNNRRSAFLPGSISDLAAGDHYLAVGMYDNDPIYAAGDGNQPLIGWTQDFLRNEGGDYVLNLTGTVYADTPTSPLRQVAMKPGGSDDLAPPTINDAGDTAFYAENYNGETGIFAQFTGQGEIRASPGVLPENIASSTDNYIQTTDGQLVVGNVADYSAQNIYSGPSAGPNSNSPSSMADFVFNRYGVYLANDLGDGVNVVTLIGETEDGTAGDFQFVFRVGNTPLAETDLSSELIAFDLRMDKLVVGQSVDNPGGMGVGTDTGEDIRFRSTGNFNVSGDLSGNAFDFGPLRGSDDGEVYVEYSIINQFNPRLIGDFDLDTYNQDDSGSVFDAWSASNDGVAIIKSGGVELTTRDDTGSFDSGDFTTSTLLQPGDFIGGDQVISLNSRWVRLNNEGEAVAMAFVGSETSLVKASESGAEVLIRGGQSAPDASGTADGDFNFNFFQNDGSRFHWNNEGQLLFEIADHPGPSDSTLVNTPNNAGAFITDGIDTVQVARKNQMVDPFTKILSIELLSGDDPGGRQAFNDWGQVAFKADVQYTVPGLIDEQREAIYVYTPELEFRGTAGDNQWDSKTNWTLSIAPAPVHDVTISFGDAVFGPGEDTTVNRLTVEGYFDNFSGVVMNVTEDVVLGSQAQLAINFSAAGLPVPEFNVGGDLTLDGTLIAYGLDGAGLGDQWVLFDVGGVVTGDFDSLLTPSVLADGLSLQTALVGSQLLLQVVGDTIEGDYNGDGFVSQPDLDLVLLNWGDDVLPAGFDADAIPGGGPFDNLVSQNELDGVLLNWGDGTPPNANAIPEPGAAILIGAGLAPVMAVRRRGRRAAA